MPKVDVYGCEIIDTLLVALMVVVINERLDLCLQICREEVVLQ